jgi:hypothetical protein
MQQLQHEAGYYFAQISSSSNRAIRVVMCFICFFDLLEMELAEKAVCPVLFVSSRQNQNRDLFA